eukprot:1624304-Rhodomonas_salina.1
MKERRAWYAPTPYSYATIMRMLCRTLILASLVALAYGATRMVLRVWCYAYGATVMVLRHTLAMLLVLAYGATRSRY